MILHLFYAGADNDLDLSEMKKEIDNVSDTGQVFKKPADVSPTEFKRSRYLHILYL